MGKKDLMGAYMVPHRKSPLRVARFVAKASQYVWKSLSPLDLMQLSVYAA